MQGGGGGGASAAAEWDDRGEHDITLFGCLSTHLLVPVFSRHAGGGDCAARAAAFRRRRRRWRRRRRQRQRWRRGLLVLAFCASSIGEERAGRRQPASFEQLEVEERDNAYGKAGFVSFME